MIIEKVCKRPDCGNTFSTEDARKIFCSHSCAAKVSNTQRARMPWSDDAKQKASAKTSARWFTGLAAPRDPPIQCQCLREGCSNIFFVKGHSKKNRKYCCMSCASRATYVPKDFDSTTETKRLIRYNEMLTAPFESLSVDRRRLRVIAEQDGKCIYCGLSHWHGVEISFELEHKDGNHQNDARENLEIRCPNCHMLTPTWRGRNRGVKVSDEQLTEALISKRTICAALNSVGMAAKGGNYKRATRLKKLLNQ